MKHGAQQMQREKVPQEFCNRFCCAFVGGRCNPMTAPPGVCLWTADLAAGYLEGITIQRGHMMTRELYAWHQSLIRSGARKWGENLKDLPWCRFMK